MCIPLPSTQLRNHSCVVSDALWQTICILETAWKVPGNSQEKSKIHENVKFFNFVLDPDKPLQSLLGTLRHSMTPYIHSRTARLHSEHSWSIEIDKLQKVGKSSSERNFLENRAHFENLERGHAQAREFSWTSRSHHPNRYISKPTWDGFRADLTTGGRAISIVVKIFLEKAPSTFATICLPIVL